MKIKSSGHAILVSKNRGDHPNFFPKVSLIVILNKINDMALVPGRTYLAHIKGSLDR